MTMDQLRKRMTNLRPEHEVFITNYDRDAYPPPSVEDVKRELGFETETETKEDVEDNVISLDRGRKND